MHRKQGVKGGAYCLYNVWTILGSQKCFVGPTLWRGIHLKAKIGILRLLRVSLVILGGHRDKKGKQKKWWTQREDPGVTASKRRSSHSNCDTLSNSQCPLEFCLCTLLLHMLPVWVREVTCILPWFCPSIHNKFCSDIPSQFLDPKQCITSLPMPWHIIDPIKKKSVPSSHTVASQLGFPIPSLQSSIILWSETLLLSS